MAVKKTQLYASLWASCDKLRGGMDSSEYKDYILTLLFMKYVTDKFKNKGAYEDIKVFDKAHDKDPDPEKRTGCSFDDFIALKGKKHIGEGMDKIIARLADENTDLKGVIDIAHFNDEKKLGSGKEMVDKLTDLISIFQRPELDFSRNKVEGDDIIGDAYEYLMRKFATESGKSKGQFYTPAEVSRILANVVGISRCTDTSATVCDPACGSGSLLIRAVDAAPVPIMGFGQEKESTTAGLAKMNAVLHRKAEIIIKSGNTFSNPQYLDKSDSSILERFDYIVANPPFSMKNWRDGIAGKEYGRFEGYGDTPPEKNGDYAWLMHILKALKSNGKAAVILPHGVLFRGNSEATIREAIIKRHWIKGIISLPANLFYGTGIAACVLVIDKEGAANRQGIFMIDASRGYVKDGNKNRLRERDIYRIITTFNEQITTDPKYARFVPNDEIEKKNGYNLNITRYIDSTDPEDIQDIYAHIHGGIPAVDIDGLSKFWEVFPSLKTELLTAISEKYYSLNVAHEDIRQTIYKNAEFSDYGEKLDEAFTAWKTKEYPILSALDEDVSARELIVSLAEDILAEFEHLTLIDKYDVYQVLLAYWNEVMNDDVSLIISERDGYANARETDDIEEEVTQGKNKGEMKTVGWEGRLIPKTIMIDAFFRDEKNAIEEAENVVAETESRLSDLIESADEESALADVAENGKVKAKDVEAKIEELTKHVETEETIELELLMNQLPMQKKRLQAYLVGHPLCESALTEKGTVTKSSITLRLFIIRTVESVPEILQDDVNQLRAALELCGKVSDYNKVVRDLNKALDEKCRARYKTLTDAEIIDLLVNKKWFDSIFAGITDLYAAISHHLTNRIIELAERYESTLPQLESDTTEYETKVKSHLERIHAYKYNEGVADGVVLDLRYEYRDVPQDLSSQDRVDQWFDVKTRGLSSRAKAKLKEKWGTMQKVYSSRSRLEKVAWDIIQDFNMKPRLMDGNGNAILVADGIPTACKYYEIFQQMGFKKCAIISSYTPNKGELRTDTVSDEDDTETFLKYEE